MLVDDIQCICFDVYRSILSTVQNIYLLKSKFSFGSSSLGIFF